MAKGYGGGMRGGMMPGGMNMNNLVKEAQKMQQKMESAKAELETRKLEVTSGGGAVKIVITGKKLIESITISEDVVDPGDIEMLQDLILTAVNEAISQMEEMIAVEMSKLTGGLGMPGGLF